MQDLSAAVHTHLNKEGGIRGVRSQVVKQQRWKAQKRPEHSKTISK